MAALDFPANPINGQTYTLNGVTYYYNSAVGGWLTQIVTPAITSSSNNQIMFNDGGVSNGSNGLLFSKSTNTVFANVVSVGTMIEFGANIDFNYTITAGKNALTAGPVSITGNNTVTIPDGSYWTVT